jgi:hypothetical protein
VEISFSQPAHLPVHVYEKAGAVVQRGSGGGSLRGDSAGLIARECLTHGSTTAEGASEILFEVTPDRHRLPMDDGARVGAASIRRGCRVAQFARRFILMAAIAAG